MSVDVKVLEDLREDLILYRNRSDDEGNRQIADALVCAIDEEIEVLHSDD